MRQVGRNSRDDVFGSRNEQQTIRGVVQAAEEETTTLEARRISMRTD